MQRSTLDERLYIMIKEHLNSYLINALKSYNSLQHFSLKKGPSCLRRSFLGSSHQLNSSNSKGKGQEVQGQATLPLCNSKKNPTCSPASSFLVQELKEGTFGGFDGISTSIS